MNFWRIIVVSPSDVGAEKASIHTIVDELNRRLEQSSIPVQLRVFDFENDVPTGLHKNGPQGLADHYLPFEDCEYVIGIFWKRFGTPVLGSQSGTEHELRRAIQAFTDNGKPDVLLYFKSDPPPLPGLEDIEQYKKLVTFREELSSLCRYRPFSDNQDFRELVAGDLWQA